MANPQIEKGHTRIANEILDHISKTNLNGTQFRIVMVIWRYTYGFQRKQHELSYAFFSQAIGIKDRKTIYRELKILIDRKIVSVVGNGSRGVNILAFNKNYDEWTDCPLNSQQSELTANTPTELTANTPTELTANTPTELTANTPHKKEKIKEKYKEKFKSSSSSEEISFSEIMSFYSQNLQRGITETPFNLELISQWFDEFGFDLLLAAMKVAAKAEAKGVNFIEGVLKNWKEAGVKTIDDARKFEREFKQNKKGFSRKQTRKEKLPDWFDENSQQQPKTADPMDIEAQKREIEEKLKQFRKGK